MNKLVLIAVGMVACVATYAQGTVTFANNSSSLVKFGSTPDVPVALQGLNIPSGTSAAVSDFRAALYWLNGATSTFEQLGDAKSITTPPGSGIFSGGVRTTGAATAAGAAGTFIVKVWSNGATYSTYELAVASGSADVYAGESASFSNATGGAGVPAGPPASLSGFTGMSNVRPVPEPSIVALGILGAAALLIRRRN